VANSNHHGADEKSGEEDKLGGPDAVFRRFVTGGRRVGHAAVHQLLQMLKKIGSC
jgi:hypothetical protein